MSEQESLMNEMQKLAQGAAFHYLDHAMTNIHLILGFPGMSPEKQLQLAEQGAALMYELTKEIGDLEDLDFERREKFVEQMAAALIDPNKYAIPRYDKW